MKATGVTRKVDELGRIVLPIELRRTLGIDIKDPLEIFVDGERIILRKYEPACVFCGESNEGTRTFHDRLVCPNCIVELDTFLSKPQAAASKMD